MKQKNISFFCFKNKRGTCKTYRFGVKLIQSNKIDRVRRNSTNGRDIILKNI